MRLHDDIDFTTLNWVKQELDETLKQARKALEAYVDDPSDTSQMRFCATYLHQVQGTLRMVELHGAALVVDAMEHVSLALLDGRVSDTDEAYSLLMRGIMQLPDYLERLQSGHRDIPVVLLPLLNDLRAVCGEPPLLETVMFAPDLSVALPASAAGPAAPLADRALRVSAAKVRKAFEATLLRWFKEDDGDAQVVVFLKSLCDRLCQITSEADLHRTWWIAGGILDGVATGALQASKPLKVLFGKLDREIKQMALHGERYFGSHPPDELCNELLYYAAHAGSGSACIDELKDVYQLDRLLPLAEELEHAKGAMSGHNRELLNAVSGAIKEDLMRVKDALDLEVRQSDRSTEGFAEQCGTLERVADTLGMLGMGVPRKVVLDQKELLERLIEAESEPSEGNLLDIAGSLLYVESSLDDHIDLLGATAPQKASGDAIPDLPKSEVRRILDALMKEASSNLQVIKQSIVEFIEAPWDHERVRDTPRLLEEIVGALKMLDLDEAAMLLDGVIAYNQVELLHKRSVPSAEDLDTFADALASLEYYLEAVREHRPGRDKILEVARHSLKKLGYLGEDAAEARRKTQTEPAAGDGEPSEAGATESPPDLAKTVELEALDVDLLEVGEPTEPVEDAEPAEVAEVAGDGDEAAQPARADIAEDIDAEIREVFIEEVEEELESLRQLQPKWKADPDDEATLTTIRRTFHTLKGSGRLVGALTIGEFGWQIESMLNRVLDGTIEASPAVVDLMDHAVAALPQLLGNVKGEGRPSIDIEAIKAVAQRLAAGEQAWLEAPGDAAVPEEAAPADTESALADDLQDRAALEPDVEEAGPTEGEEIEALDLDEMQAVDQESAESTALQAAEHDEPELDWVATEELGLGELQPEGLATEESELGDAELDWLQNEEGDLGDLELEELEPEDLAELQLEGLEPDEAEGAADDAHGAETLEFEAPSTDVDPQTLAEAAETTTAEDLAGAESWLDFAADDEQEGVEARADEEVEQAVPEGAESNPVDDLIAAATLEMESDEADSGNIDGPQDYDLESFLDDISLDDGLPEGEAAAQFPELEAMEEELIADEAASGAIDPVLLDILRTEVGGHLGVITDYLEGAPGGGPPVVNESLLRAVHTLNGAIAMVDLPALAAVTGPLEGYVKRLRLAELAPSEFGAQALTDVVGAVRGVVAGLGDPEAEAIDTDELSERLIGLRDELPEPDGLQSLFPVFEEDGGEPGAGEPLEEASESPAEAGLEESAEAAEVEAGLDESVQVAEAEAEADVELDESSEPAEAQAEAEESEQVEVEAGHEETVEVAEAAAQRQESEAPDAELEPEPDRAAEVAGEAIAELASDLEAWEQSAEDSSERVAPEEETVPLAALGDLDDDLLEIFLQEGAEILDESDHKMAQWRETPDDNEAVLQLQRELHTLKGGARMTGLSPIGDLSHAMESLFEGVVEGRVEVTRRTIEILEYGFDRLHQMLAKVRARAPIATGRGAIMQIEALLTGNIPEIPEVTEDQELVDEDEPAAVEVPPEERPTALDEQDARGAAPVRPQQELIRVRADLLDNLVNYAGEVSIYRSRLEQQIGTFRFNLVEFDQTVKRLRDQLRKLEMETEAQILSRYQREAEELRESFDPLELDRFSTLQQLSRALAESVSDLVSIQGMLDDLTRQSETLLLQQSRVNSDLQEGLMRTRMIPFDSLVPRLRRILRQTSQELGKRANLRVEGAQGEMDRTVLERITAPLEHMLRNAIVHGLETPEERERAGKPAEGAIRVSVAREATEVVITVHDDGAGIDDQKVREKALERGMLKPDAELTDRDLYGFILETGFTTVDEVTKVAGRGVGMDVVNNEIKQLGGSLDISSSRGAGTTFVIRLPFTLAVTHAIMVRLGDSTFAVPLSSIQGVVRMSRREFDRRMLAGETSYEFTGEDYQLQELSVLLGLERQDYAEDEMVPVLMSRIGDQRAAIRVDLVMGSREVVVKSVGPQISSVPGIFGATILGDGSVVMILDLGPLIRRGAALRLTAAEPGSTEPRIEVKKAPAHLPLIMVVDDSITMRKVTTRVLQRHEMEVVTAKDGVDALEQLQDRLPDLMLLDIEMPRMDGYELATHMRNDARLKGVPIIMVTSRGGEKHRERALEIGVNRYLGKPYQEAELLTNVRELLDETVAAD